MTNVARTRLPAACRSQMRHPKPPPYRTLAGENVPVDLDAVHQGIPAARKRLGSTVHETALGDLSAVDRTYLLAMSHDSGCSHTGTVAERMGESAYYASVYRSRLIDAGIIEAAGRGYVDFTIPYLREYLREHAARYEMNSPARRPRR